MPDYIRTESSVPVRYTDIQKKWEEQKRNNAGGSPGILLAGPAAGHTEQHILRKPRGLDRGAVKRRDSAGYGYYNSVNGVKWFLIQGGGLTGYCSSAYLVK